MALFRNLQCRANNLKLQVLLNMNKKTILRNICSLCFKRTFQVSQKLVSCYSNLRKLVLCMDMKTHANPMNGARLRQGFIAHLYSLSI
jgi:hypothetical protein